MTVAFGRLRSRVRLAFIVDLGAIGTAALMSLVGVTALGIDPRTAHLSLTALTVAVLAGVAVIAAVGGRAQRDGRFAWVGSALGLFAVVCLPLSALGPSTLQRSSGLLAALVTAQVAVGILLLFAGLAPGRPGRPAPWVAGGVALGLAVAAGVIGDRVPWGAVLEDATARGGVAVGWVVAALAALHDGLRRGDSTDWRIGLGLAVIATAQLHEVVVRASFANPSVIAVGLWFVGATGALAAALRSLRRSVTGLVSEREQHRAALQEAVGYVERAAALARERDHELANGLAGLAGIAYLLDQPVERSDGAALRSAVLAELARLHAMLAQPPARCTVGPGVASTFDLGVVLVELVALRRAAGQDLELVVDDPLSARGDRDAVVQVMTNLLVNCARHAPGSHVLVQARQEADHVSVEVRDDGPGAPSVSDGVRDRGVTGADVGGSGLGLSVSRRLAAEQGGDLEVVPTGGRGFLARFTIPAPRRAPGLGAPGKDEKPVSR